MCTSDYLYSNTSNVINDQRVTHIIIPRGLYNDVLMQNFEVMIVNSCFCGFSLENEGEMKNVGSSDNTPKNNNNSQKILINAYSLLPDIFDFFRKVALYRGILLFVDDSLNLCKVCKEKLGSRDGIIRECFIACMSLYLQENSYEMWTLSKLEKMIDF